MVPSTQDKEIKAFSPKETQSPFALVTQELVRLLESPPRPGYRTLLGSGTSVEGGGAQVDDLVTLHWSFSLLGPLADSPPPPPPTEVAATVCTLRDSFSPLSNPQGLAPGGRARFIRGWFQPP